MRITEKSDYVDAVSMGTDISGSAILLDAIFGYVYQCVWTGTPLGTLKNQGSNDGVTWFDLDTQAAGGAAGSKLFEKVDCMFKYTRLIYTRTGSTGSLTVKFYAKGQ